MFINFFFALKEAKLPVSLREYLTLIEALKAGIAQYDVEEFYFLARSALVKDERNLDKFDVVFAQVFNGLEAVSGGDGVESVPLPDEWLRKLAEKHLSDEEKTLVEALGGWEKLMETLKQRLE
ncbi:MAG: VWA domain-containing protein, partial [Pseudomonadota bacterium]